MYRKIVNVWLMAWMWAVSLVVPAMAQKRNVSDPPRPNIIFILVDDLRWDAMGFMGKFPFLTTPHIDRLRSEGIHFENAFVTHALCAPSRATFLTGTFSQRHGVATNQENREFDPQRTPSFPMIFQENGYTTGFIGKWHMGNDDSPRQGFDYWCSFLGQGKYYDNNLNINGKHVKNKGYVTDELNKYALAFLEAHAGQEQPFCLYLSHKAVHGPFTPPDRHKDAYSKARIPEPGSWKDDMKSKPRWQRVRQTEALKQRDRDKDLAKIQVDHERKFKSWDGNNVAQKNYYRSLSAVDEGIGEIYEFLKARGILDNTIIVFAGDNGYFHGEHGMGDKRLAYNESMRIPLLMRFPKIAGKGQTISKMVLNADVAPTFLDLAGIKIPGQMQGKSFKPLLTGAEIPWRTSFLFTYWRDLNLFLPRIIAVRTEKYLYATYPDIQDIDELYDEQQDPYELNNLSENADFRSVKQQLAGELERLKRSTDYLDHVPRPDKEPDSRLKTGLLLDLKVGKLSSGKFPTIPYNPDLEPSVGSYVIDCLVKPESPDGVIISAGSQQGGWALFIDDGRFGVVVAHNSRLQFADSKSEATGKWSHVVAVIENHTNILKLYVNGQLAGKKQILLPLRKIRENQRDISIGIDAGDLIDAKEISKQPFKGVIDEVKLYRRPFSDRQLKRLSTMDQRIVALKNNNRK